MENSTQTVDTFKGEFFFTDIPIFTILLVIGFIIGMAIVSVYFHKKSKQNTMKRTRSVQDELKKISTATTPIIMTPVIIYD